jgi:hypothetical protein
MHRSIGIDIVVVEFEIQLLESLFEFGENSDDSLSLRAKIAALNSAGSQRFHHDLVITEYTNGGRYFE